MELLRLQNLVKDLTAQLTVATGNLCLTEKKLQDQSRMFRTCDGRGFYKGKVLGLSKDDSDKYEVSYADGIFFEKLFEKDGTKCSDTNWEYV